MLIGIITIIDNNNYGNRLQNYALNYYCRKILNLNTFTLYNDYLFNNKKNLLIIKIKHYIKKIIKKFLGSSSDNTLLSRKKNFSKFDKNIDYYKKSVDGYSKLKEFDYLIVGSDQVWNPNYLRLSDVDVLKNVSNENKKISYAASFGVDVLSNTSKEKIKKYISKFKCISVREESGKRIIEKITGRKDLMVLVDPTMLLETKEWDKVSNRPKQIDDLCKNSEKYILNYFLGSLNDNRRKEIERVAKENNCKIINILDKNDPFYSCGPSEFLWLEKNAFLICTDSFHSSVFAILYKRPFIVFNRDDGQKGKNCMNSRLDTLLSRFKLEDRYYKDKITDDLLKCDYSHVDDILKEERDKANKFLKEAIK